MNISNGGISYEDGDPNNIFVGDRIEYYCANGTELHGSRYRFCQRNGNWSDSEPECKGQATNYHGPFYIPISLVSNSVCLTDTEH